MTAPFKDELGPCLGPWVAAGGSGRGCVEARERNLDECVLFRRRARGLDAVDERREPRGGVASQR